MEAYVHLYGDFVRTIAQRFDRALDEIAAHHNFELGDEFEVAICKTLRRFLPQRFGICRGYAVNAAGELAGDDIIIYDRHLFPTLRALEQDSYTQKEKVPIEAIFAYIEAKYTLDLYAEEGSSFAKAIRQVAAVKALCAQRAAISLNRVSRHTYLGEGFNTPVRRGWPPMQNPMYTAVYGRRVRFQPRGQPVGDAQQISARFVGESVAWQRPPDLIAAGTSNVILPVLTVDAQQRLVAPFVVEDPDSNMTVRCVDGTAFGIALAHLLWALDEIDLGSMPWNNILLDGILPRT